MKYLTKPSSLVLFVLAAVCTAPGITRGQNSGMPQTVVDSNAKVMPFAPGIISTHYDEGATSFTPDGKTVYFTMGVFSTVCRSKFSGGKWGRPEVASFSGRWPDQDAFLSPDGKRLFYSSNRPIPGAPQDVQNNFDDLWYVDNTGGDNWGEPHHLDTVINTGRCNDYAPSVDRNGTLYWCSPRRDGNKGMQGFYSLWLGDHYGPAKLIQIPGVDHIQDPFIAPNGKYLVFLSGKEFFVAMKQQDGWSPALKIGAPVSMGDYIGSPYVSLDGKTLYFTTGRRKGFYKRDANGPPLTYDELLNENNGIFNGSGNILTVPVNLPAGN